MSYVLRTRGYQAAAGLGILSPAEMAAMAARSAAQSAQQQYEQKQAQLTMTPEAAARASVNTSKNYGPKIFDPAAAAAATVASAKQCPSGFSKKDCDSAAKAIATAVAVSAERSRTAGAGGPRLAFPTADKLTTYDLCVAYRNELDADYGLVVRELIDLYFELWPSEAQKVIRPDKKLVLPAFSMTGKTVGERTVSSDLVRMLQARMVANGARMTTNGRRPTSPSYCITSGDQPAAAVEMVNTYALLIAAEKLTAAELVGLAVGQRIETQFAKGALMPPVPAQTEQAAPPVEVAEVPIPPAEYEEPGSPPPAYVQTADSGFGGVAWKWWVIGGVALAGGVWLFRRKG